MFLYFIQTFSRTKISDKITILMAESKYWELK